jgi:hypothetical protein
MTIPRINPETWDAAAGLMANSIDVKRARGVRHPFHADPDASLGVLRNEYDHFSATYYGAEVDEDIACNWFQAIAIITLDLGDHSESASAVLPLLRSKMEDYGYDNIDRFGLDGILVRLHDKIARLENLWERGAEANNESLTDTHADIIGYCIIGCMVAMDLWRLPLNDRFVHPSMS